ncbi:MAG: acyltransferase [Pseudomonadota bacterium]
MVATPKRFYLLDIIRALAAFVIVLMHLKYFYLLPGGAIPAGFSVEDQIFYGVLFPIYEYGATAVQVFFCMSGFVFFWLYRDSIGSGRTTAWEFFVYRFSRLYPLHFATLIFVAVAQWWFSDASGGHIVFGPNTSEQFVLQLFLASEWGIGAPSSFNGPIWTVSGEAAAYALFFAMAALRFTTPRHIVLALLLAGLVHEINHRLGHALFFFFTGGLICAAWDLARIRFSRRTFARIFLPVSVAALVTACAIVPSLPEFDGVMLLWFVVAPLCIVVPVLVQTCWPHFGRRFAAVGDLTYGTYLLHFPIQLVIIGIAWQHGHAVEVTPVLFFAYLTAVTVGAALVFRFLERPCQRALRTAWLKPRAPAPTHPDPRPAPVS